MSKIKTILSIIFYSIYGAVCLQLTQFSCDYCNSIANTLVLLQPCTKPSIYPLTINLSGHLIIAQRLVIVYEIQCTNILYGIDCTCTEILVCVLYPATCLVMTPTANSPGSAPSVNALWSSEATWRQIYGPSLVQVIAWFDANSRFDAKPLHVPDLLIRSQWTYFNYFVWNLKTWKYIRKCHLQNLSHFFQTQSSIIYPGISRSNNKTRHSEPVYQFMFFIGRKKNMHEPHRNFTKDNIHTRLHWNGSNRAYTLKPMTRLAIYTHVTASHTKAYLRWNRHYDSARWPCQHDIYIHTPMAVFPFQRKHYTSPTYKLPLSYTVISDVYRSLIPNKTTFT